LDEETCLVRVGSGFHRCFTGLVDEIGEGDWLLVHAGFALEKITPVDARENLDIVRRLIAGGEQGDG